ncbi:MAG: cytochrome c-type biogenesis protein [Acidimicrobiales bacterium]
MSWLALALVIAGAVVIGSRSTPGPASIDERVRTVAAGIRCPTCSGQSAAVSDAPASQAIRAEIARRFEAGQTAQQIQAFLVSRYGPSILLRPPASGVAGLVWVIPVAAGICAVFGLAVAFRRWRIRPGAPVSDADRAIVAAALAARSVTSPAEVGIRQADGEQSTASLQPGTERTAGRRDG